MHHDDNAELFFTVSTTMHSWCIRTCGEHTLSSLFQFAGNTASPIKGLCYQQLLEPGQFSAVAAKKFSDACGSQKPL